MDERPAGTQAEIFRRASDAVRRAAAEQDPGAIRDAYKVMGNELEDLVGTGSAPLLSYPDTAQQVAAEVPAGRNVLDVGCGPNPALSVLLGRDGRFVVGLDIGEGTVRLARRAAEAEGIDLTVVAADAERLPFRSGVFDAVVSDDTIEHVPDDAQAISEIARVAAPGGTVVIATPNRRSAQVILRKLRDRARRVKRPASAYYAAESHLREYTVREFDRLVSPYLDVQRFRPNGWSTGRRELAWLGTRLAHLVPATSRAVIAVCRPR